MKCILCDNIEFEVVYDGIIRSGSPGKLTKENHQIIKCTSCGITKIKEFPKIDYDSGKYRLEYNDSSSISDYYTAHDEEQNERISNIGIQNFRDKIVLDFGCGGGSFLDSIKGVAKKTIGIEPNVEYLDSLISKGHEIYRSIDECKKLYGTIDIVISFGVIEHIQNPLDYLKSSFDLLKPAGKLYLETDNLDDVLFQFNITDFNSFYYRTVHNWYFDKNSLKLLCEKAGFSFVQPGFRHGYGLSNTMNWLNLKSPKGNDRLPFLNETLDYHWKKTLEKEGFAELLYFVLQK